MFKTTMASNRATKMFDAINKMARETEVANASEVARNASEVAAEPVSSFDYIVTVPNEKLPLNIAREKPIVVCVYQIRTDGLYPFILFFCQKASAKNEVGFITLPSMTSGGAKKIKYAALSSMKTLLPEATLSYAGFSETKDKNIIILKASDMDSNEIGSNVYETNNIWASPFEIINKKKVMNYGVEQSILDFFYAHPAFLILKGPGEAIYESPMVGYYKSQHLDRPREEMDIYRETLIPALGKCYYLLMHHVSGDNIMRIAFFAGEMLIFNGASYTIEANSILCPEHKRYIIQNYNQHVVL
jgi:hypothetical protein